MPPAISDDEASASGNEDEIPFKDNKNMLDAQNGDENSDDDEEEEEEEEEEYIVEAILNHAFEDDVLKYEVKWAGYEKKSERTWEPEENLSGATDILAAYHKKIGGRPKLGDPTPGAGRKRKQSGTPVASKTPKQGRRKSKAGKTGDDSTPTLKSKIKSEPVWEPPQGLWEDLIIAVESLEQTIDAKTGEPKLMGYVQWNDEKRTQHAIGLLYRKCPQKMLQFYERHLTITS
ncbi:uncharacterized protein BDZ99DRAFT_468876 [Mytilinidion resinicola]|uniref:Chromo domain-containing protein n=1 Tax=Mytilinidion resinicola TaxID=574789 RepID=A0A6A6Y318_9PEZI|nr:uncharacterized protein BDZ99DRAFT_468876 [Mytilinidion resinicola]KAF2802404.1 hypothetical protein BDZ99DRAFT_468876 [Mytilinidion resinicola]